MKTEGHESCQISAARGGVRAEGQLPAAAFTFPLDASTEPPPHDTHTHPRGIAVAHCCGNERIPIACLHVHLREGKEGGAGVGGRRSGGRNRVGAARATAITCTHVRLTGRQSERDCGVRAAISRGKAASCRECRESSSETAPSFTHRHRHAPAAPPCAGAACPAGRPSPH